MPGLQLLLFSELLRENQQEGVKLPPSPPRFELKYGLVVEDLHLICCYTAAIID